MNRTELMQRLDTLEREMGWRKQHITDCILRINRYNAGEAMKDDIYFVRHDVQCSLNETREELKSMINEFNSILDQLRIEVK